MAYMERDDGVRICYETFGFGDRTPLLLSHGFGSSSRMWAPNVKALAADRLCVTWDMRGHGSSDSPDEAAAYSAEATVADMLALLDRVGADRAVLGGLSLGGYMSLAFYLQYPERVAALLLFDTGPGFRNDEARQRWNDRAIAQAERIERDGIAALGTDGPLHDSPAGVAWAARGMLTQRDETVIESLPAITVPTLVLVGSQDTPFLGAANYMATKIPDAKLVVIDGAGHASNADAPDDFNARTSEFLNALGE
jgi:pimeloyl-ACP methyl ester carboxylesterase